MSGKISRVGEQTDVVQKEMYIFEDKGGRSIALRPEGTAGVIRAYIENGMSSLPSPLKSNKGLSKNPIFILTFL